MLSTPEFRQRAATIALCLLIAGSLALAQNRLQRQQPDTSLPVNARQIAQQTLPSVVFITLNSGCYSRNFFVNDDLNATIKHVLDHGGRGAVSIAGKRLTFPIMVGWGAPHPDLALVRVIRADANPLALSTRGLPALVCITRECLVAENRRWR